MPPCDILVFISVCFFCGEGDIVIDNKDANELRKQLHGLRTILQAMADDLAVLWEPHGYQKIQLTDKIMRDNPSIDKDLVIGQELINDSFSSGDNLESFANALRMRIKYLLLDREVQVRLGHSLRRELWRSRRRRFGGEEWKYGNNPTDSD